MRVKLFTLKDGGLQEPPPNKICEGVILGPYPKRLLEMGPIIELYANKLEPILYNCLRFWNFERIGPKLANFLKRV